jgi:hypothetical protein
MSQHIAISAFAAVGKKNIWLHWMEDFEGRQKRVMMKSHKDLALDSPGSASLDVKTTKTYLKQTLRPAFA